MKILAIANHKGGVGKTVTTHALGEALAVEMGQRVLLVDLDPQAGLTGACGVTGIEAGLAEVLSGEVSISKILRELTPSLKLAPADLALAPLEISLSNRPGRVNLLKDALDSLGDDFDLALIDCPPNLGLLTMNALAAADGVLVPTQPQAIDLRGLKVFLDAINQVKTSLNPSLELLGVLITFYDSRFHHHQNAIEAMFVDEITVLDFKIGRSVRVAEAAERGKSIVIFDPKNPQAENYCKLARLIFEWTNSGG
jgi:chromosome partitioning protein